MDCSQPGSSVHGVFQARMLEQVTISFSRESSQGLNLCFLCPLHCRQILYPLNHQGSLYICTYIYIYTYTCHVYGYLLMYVSFTRSELCLARTLICFPDGSDGKESTCNAGVPGLILGLGKPPRGGNDNPLQYSCLETPTDTGAWWLPMVLRVAESDTTEQLTLTFLLAYLFRLPKP